MNVGGRGSWEAQEVSRSPEVNLTSTELSEHVAAKGYLLTYPTTLLVTHGQAKTQTPVTQTYATSGTVPGQLLRSTNQTASTMLPRPTL